MRLNSLAVLACVLALAGCGSPAPKKVARKPATPAAKSAPAKAPTATPKASEPQATPPRAVASAPSAASPEGRYAEAVQLLKSGQLPAAESALLRVVKELPSQTGPHTNLGIVQARLNKKSEALAAFTRAVALDSRNAVAHNWLGVLARESGDHRRAEQAYLAALNADPAYAPAQLNLAILYDLYLQRPAEAVAAYRRYEQMTGNKDARAAVWAAELQARLAAPPAPAQAVPTAAPKPAAPAVRKTGAKS